MGRTLIHSQSLVYGQCLHQQLAQPWHSDSCWKDEMIISGLFSLILSPGRGHSRLLAPLPSIGCAHPALLSASWATMHNPIHASWPTSISSSCCACLNPHVSPWQSQFFHCPSQCSCLSLIAPRKVMVEHDRNSTQSHVSILAPMFTSYGFSGKCFAFLGLNFLI